MDFIFFSLINHHFFFDSRPIHFIQVFHFFFFLQNIYSHSMFIKTNIEKFYLRTALIITAKKKKKNKIASKND